MIAAPLTACNVVLAASGWVPGLSVKFLGAADAIILALTGAVALLLLLHLDFLRKRGEWLFDEISEEMHWRVGAKRKKSNSRGADGTEEGRPSPRVRKSAVRTALREFARAARLPLVYGWRGPGVYAVINLAATFVGLIGMRLVP